MTGAELVFGGRMMSGPAQLATARTVAHTSMEGVNMTDGTRFPPRDGRSS